MVDTSMVLGAAFSVCAAVLTASFLSVAALQWRSQTRTTKRGALALLAARVK